MIEYLVQFRLYSKKLPCPRATTKPSLQEYTRQTQENTVHILEKLGRAGSLIIVVGAGGVVVLGSLDNSGLPRGDELPEKGEGLYDLVQQSRLFPRLDELLAVVAGGQRRDGFVECAEVGEAGV